MISAAVYLDNALQAAPQLRRPEKKPGFYDSLTPSFKSTYGESISPGSTTIGGSGLMLIGYNVRGSGRVIGVNAGIFMSCCVVLSMTFSFPFYINNIEQ